MPPKKPRPTKKIRSDDDDTNENAKVPKESPPAPTTHSVALATTRNAIVAFGAGSGARSVPVERRIAQYL